MKTEKPIIKKGDKVLCPTCKNPLLFVREDLYTNQKVAPESFLLLDHKTDLTAKDLVSPCCKTFWFNNGAVYTESKGWIPYDPHGYMH